MVNRFVETCNERARRSGNFRLFYYFYEKTNIYIIFFGQKNKQKPNFPRFLALAHWVSGDHDEAIKVLANAMTKGWNSRYGPVLLEYSKEIELIKADKSGGLKEYYFRAVLSWQTGLFFDVLKQKLDLFQKHKHKHQTQKKQKKSIENLTFVSFSKLLFKF